VRDKKLYLKSVEFKSVDLIVNPWKVFSSYFVPQIVTNLLFELPRNAINCCYIFKTKIAFGGGVDIETLHIFEVIKLANLSLYFFFHEP
jgi:hypothetical protein